MQSYSIYIVQHEYHQLMQYLLTKVIESALKFVGTYTKAPG